MVVLQVKGWELEGGRRGEGADQRIAPQSQWTKSSWTPTMNPRRRSLRWVMVVLQVKGRELEGGRRGNGTAQRIAPQSQRIKSSWTPTMKPRRRLLRWVMVVLQVKGWELEGGRRGEGADQRIAPQSQWTKSSWTPTMNPRRRSLRWVMVVLQVKGLDLEGGRRGRGLSRECHPSPNEQSLLELQLWTQEEDCWGEWWLHYKLRGWTWREGEEGGGCPENVTPVPMNEVFLNSNYEPKKKIVEVSDGCITS